MGFKNPPVAGGGELIRDLIHSRAWVNPGDSGWAILRNGIAYFTNVILNPGGGLSSISLAELAAKAFYEVQVKDEEAATTVTTAVRAEIMSLDTLSTPAVGNPIRDHENQVHIKVHVDVRPNAAAAGDFFCELDESDDNATWFTLNRRIVLQSNTAGDRLTADIDYYRSGFLISDSHFYRVMVYHNGAVAYTVQDGGNTYMQLSRKVVI